RMTPEKLAPKESPAMNRFALRVALVPLVLCLAGCPKPKPKPAPPPADPPIAVKAGDLLKEYSTNALAADGKDKGKVLQVSGKFKGVATPFGGLTAPVLQLEAEDAGELTATFVQCRLDESAKDAAAQLKPGQAIKVQGTCNGQALSQVNLSNCTLVN